MFVQQVKNSLTVELNYFETNYSFHIHSDVIRCSMIPLQRLKEVVSEFVRLLFNKIK